MPLQEYWCKRLKKAENEEASSCKQKKQYKVDVIIAALNEEEGIGPTLEEMLRVICPDHVILVDGHSHDRTVEIAEKMGAQVLFQEGKGKGDALAKAVRQLDSETDYVIITDADYTYPAVHVPEMIEILEGDKKVGMVCGNRFNNSEKKNGLDDIFYIGNRLLAFSHNLLNGVTLQDPLTGLRVIRAEILRSWKVRSKGFDIEVELNHQVERRGFGIVELPISYRKRLGKKKLNPSHGATIFKRILLETTY
jgi:glycosyltransferase involved in cell wall biosynthesis